MSKLRIFSIAALVLSAQPTSGQSLPDGIELFENIGCSSNSVCLNQSSLFKIDTSRRSVDISSAVKYTEGKSFAAASDDLIGYTVKEDALATFSGGFFDFSNAGSAGTVPVGGLKVAGIEVSNLNARWKSSALVCSQTEGAALSITELASEQTTVARNAYQRNDDCLQSGPLVFNINEDVNVLRDRITTLPSDFWDRKTTRQVLVQFTDENIGFLHAKSASLEDINQVLAEFEVDGVRVMSAVNLNGGAWSGYIVRTADDPLTVGDVLQAYPSAFVVRRYGEDGL